MKKLGLLIVVVLVGVLGVFLSPYYTLYQIKSAYEKGDYAKAVSYVDFERVGKNAKVQLHQRLDHTLNHNKQLNAIASVMPAVKDELSNQAKTAIDESVNGALTAQNLEKTLAGEPTPESKKLVAVWAFVSDYVDYERLIKDALLHGTDTAIKNQESVVKERALARLGKNAPNDSQMAYCGTNCFEVTGKVSGQPVEARLTRVGVLGWKIDEIKLP